GKLDILNNEICVNYRNTIKKIDIFVHSEIIDESVDWRLTYITTETGPGQAANYCSKRPNRLTEN
ncbi:14203_t:CDS:2, partial [Dentiscutata erythropus]